MAETKIRSFPTIEDVSVLTEETATGFARSFTGDIYSNRGRIGGKDNYWDISEGALTAVGASTGTVYINYGKTSFSNTTTGFILGLHEGTPKFYIGSSSQYLNWTGAALNIAGAITGSTITASIFQTATSGERVIMGESLATGDTDHMIWKKDQNGETIFVFGYSETAGAGAIQNFETNKYVLQLRQLGIGSGHCLDLVVGAAAQTANVINIQNAGSGYDIEGTSDTWQITKAGAITAASFGGITSANLVDKSATEAITGAWTFSTNFPVTPSAAPTTNYQVANKKYVDDSLGNITVTAGQVLSDRDPVYISKGDASGYHVEQTSDNSTSQYVTAAAATNYVSQGFKVLWDTDIDKIYVYGKRAGAAGAYYFNVAIWTDDGNGKPNSEINNAYQVLNMSSIAVTDAWVECALVTGPSLTAGTQYHIVAWVSSVSHGAPDSGGPYFIWVTDTTEPYTDGTCRYYDGGSWTDASRDAMFKTYGDCKAGYAYKADAAATTTADTFAGFVDGATSINTSASIQISGEMDSFSGLTVGDLYYLNTETIGTSAGTQDIKAGVALSATNLAINISHNY